MSVIFAIILFSLLILVHELGHFVAAKLSGVQVNEFSMFMGPLLWKKQAGETQYSIRLIPIGGYCAMEGEDGGSDNPRSFDKAAWWKRFLILVAGAAMNFIVGVALMAVVFLPVKRTVVPVIVSFEPEATVNGADGLRVGDRIVSIDGEKIYVYSNVSLILSLNPGDIHTLVVERDGQKVTLPNFQLERYEADMGGGITKLRFGINFASMELNLPQRLQNVWNRTLDTMRMVRLSLQMLVRGQVGLSDMSGPVGIVGQMAVVAEASPSRLAALMNMLYFGAFIAINLAIMNLLPIPALDGGRVVGLLLTTAAERVTHKKIDPKYEGYLHGAGMVLLLGLMAVIMFKDIFVLFKR